MEFALNAELGKTLAWLTNQGYPLEMEVGRAFRDSGWRVEHAKWYVDIATGKPRPIDLFASWSIHRDEPLGAVTLSLAIECKKSIGKPWVVLASEHSHYPTALDEAISAELIGRSAMFVAGVRQASIPEMLRPAKRIGHGIVKAHTENKSGDPTSPFAAVRSAVAACTSIGRQNDEFAMSFAAVYPSVHVVVPVVLLEGTLFEYSLSEAGNGELTEVSISQLLAGAGDGTQSLITQLVTKNAVEGFASALAMQARLFCNSMLPHGADVLATAAQRRQAAVARTFE